MVMKNVTKKIQKIPYLFLLMLFSFVTASFCVVILGLKNVNLNNLSL